MASPWRQIGTLRLLCSDIPTGSLGLSRMKHIHQIALLIHICPHRGLLKISNQRPKYQITHPSGKIGKTQDVKLRLHYNVQPWVGPLAWDQEVDIGLWHKLEGGISTEFALPPVKKKD